MHSPEIGSTVAAPMDGLVGARRLKAILGVSAAIGLATLDAAITNTALPTIANDLQTTEASAIWIVTAYQIAVMAALLPLASLGDIIGHRRVYVTGIYIFTLTSLVCGLAWSLPVLVVARALQGVGAAAIMSGNTALIRYIYPARSFGHGLGRNALVVATCFTLGPTVASAILSVATWHWLFLVNVPVGIAAIVSSYGSLPETPHSGHRFEWLPALLSVGVLGLLSLGIGHAAQFQPWPLWGGEVAGAVLCVLALLRLQAGHPAPILPSDLFRRPLFTLSALTACASFSAQGLAFVSLPFLLQSDLGHSQVETGFLITPWPAVVAIMGPIAGRLSDRYPPAILAGFGLLLLGCGLTALATIGANPSALDIGWRMALCGAGFGFFQSPNLKSIMTSAPPSRSGGASGIVAAARLLGQASGAALVAFCFHIAGPAGPHYALWLGCAFAFTGCVFSFLRLRAS